MSDAASHFSQRILVRQLLVALAAFLGVGVFAPRLLVLEEDMALAVLTVGAMLAVLALAVAAAMSLAALREHRYVVRALALGSRAIEPDDLGHLADLPSSLSVRFFTVSSLISALVLVPGIRPEKLDDGRAVSLLILSITILGGAAIPHYVLTRQATIELIELSPLEPLTQLLETLEKRRIPGGA